MRKTLFRLPLHLALIFFGILWLIPTLGLLITSFRDPSAIAASGWWTVFPKLFSGGQFSLQNYVNVVLKEGFGRSFINSLTISIPATLLSVFIASFAAFGFAWLRFAGRKFLFMMVVALMVIPLQMTFIPILPVYSKLGLAGTFPGIWLAHTAYGLPLTTYLVHNFMASIPRDLFDSAAIDGATPLTTFWRIVMPISLPAIASVFIFQFLWIWNDLLVALIYLGARPNVAPMTLKIANLVTNRGQDWELLTAAAFVSMALPLIVFFSLQRY
ncbi:MAG TPA: carbohydrate ABC transporter permease, partial [Candidatus Acetothermia bacterium]|nr:carbohydrate ABC transporter permease [Candidatus Acetothermia bacterium]HEX32491.1 carbohydrate ABC transporter permease [Candidatus Acetothermia bacterium]